MTKRQILHKTKVVPTGNKCKQQQNNNHNIEKQAKYLKICNSTGLIQAVEI